MIMTEQTNRYGKRPELGELVPGQRVMVYRSTNDMHCREPEERAVPARIVKANRVWIELETANFVPSQIGHRTWRMRRNTQDEASRYSGSDASFATLEQYEWDETRNWAAGFLEKQGIRVDWWRPWSGREVELADIIASTMQKEGE
jgi:hypothetical protein